MGSKPIGAASPQQAYITSIETAESRYAFISGKLPAKDGDLIDYDIVDHKYRSFGAPGLTGSDMKFRGARTDKSYQVLFVNGINNQPLDLKVSAGATAAVSGGMVKGLFNHSSGVLVDLIQCLTDKTTFETDLQQAALGITPPSPFVTGLINVPIPKQAAGTPVERVYKLLAGRNRATAELFKYLTTTTAASVRIVAHSQGNLIASVAVRALETIQGSEAVRKKVRVYAVAPPVFSWPDGFPSKPSPFTFVNDVVPKLGSSFGGKLYRPTQVAVSRKIVGAGGKAIDSPEIEAWDKGPEITVCTGDDLFPLNYSCDDVPLPQAHHSYFIYLEAYWDQLAGCFS